jgi:hypothetical protein
MNIFEAIGDKLSKRMGGVKNTNHSFVSPDVDGSIAIDASDFNVSQFDINATWKNSAELIKQYRVIANTPEANTAIDDIINEAIVFDVNQDSVSINLDKLELPENIKDSITSEFFNIQKKFDFNYNGDEIFRKWYVDGRIFFHIIVNDSNLKKGITELRYIDSTKIQLIKEVIREKDENQVDVVKEVKEYYLYTDDINGHSTTLQIDPASIIYADSGIFDDNSNQALSYLHKAIKPLNMLNMLEDATTVYRITRAPEKRVFYIDVGDLPKTRAEQYMKSIMSKYKNKMVYDSNTGTINGAKHTVSMLEDFWIPRRSSSSTTEIDTLPTASGDYGLDELLYFRKNAYKALHVPSSRLEDGATYGFGRQSEIARDEIKFAKFINKLRKKFSLILFQALRVQLVLKGVINKNEWKGIKELINFEFMDDTFFVELKESEILKERLEVLSNMTDYVGSYYSHDYIRKKVLKQSEHDIEEIDANIKDELNIKQYKGDGDGY